MRIYTYVFIYIAFDLRIVHIKSYICDYVCMYVYMCMYLYVCMYLYMYTYMFITNTYTIINLHGDHIKSHIYEYICVYMCMHILVYIYVYFKYMCMIHIYLFINMYIIGVLRTQAVEDVDRTDRCYEPDLLLCLTQLGDHEIWCVAVCCSVLQCAAGCVSPSLAITKFGVLLCVADCCSVLQCAVVCCSVLQCVSHSTWQSRNLVCCSVL